MGAILGGAISSSAKESETMNPPVFVISLARAKDRRAAIVARLNEAGIRHEIMDAVDGKNSDLSEYAERLRHIGECEKQLGVVFDRGSIGCYLSHYRAWEKIARKNISAAVILEDDAVLENSFMRVVSDVVGCKYEWDVVLLHAEGRQGGVRKICRLDGGGEMVQYMRHPYALVSYLVSLRGAKKLLEYCRHLRLPIDSEWKAYRWGGRFYCVRPQVATVSGADSTIMQVAKETGGEDGGDFKRVPTTIFGRIAQSFIRKRDRFKERLYFYSHRPKKRSE